MSQLGEAMPLPEVASLHEKSVQAVARGDVAPQRKTRRSFGRRIRTTTTRDTRVCQAVMQMALALANGDASRLSIINEGEVIVFNNKRGT